MHPLLKKIMLYVLGLIALVLFIILYARWFEWSSIYFPYKVIELTPASIGLKYEDVYFRTPDGARLNGWFIPDGSSPRATVLFCHGNAGNISHRLDIIRIFNELGLNVFIFDYRGYGRSSGLPTEKGTYLDALAAYDYLLTRKNMDKEKILVYGKSLGGAVGVELATKRRVCAVISDSTFTSTVDMGKEIYPFLPLKSFIRMKYDTLSKIGGLSVPVLIIHSEDDEIVPFHHGEKLFEEAAEPKKLYRMHGGHNDAIIIYADEFQKGIGVFLAQDCKL
jgi:fermentation-respiration switch protein FrsA (DUF1100 family)